MTLFAVFFADLPLTTSANTPCLPLHRVFLILPFGHCRHSQSRLIGLFPLTPLKNSHGENDVGLPPQACNRVSVLVCADDAFHGNPPSVRVSLVFFNFFPPA